MAEILKGKPVVEALRKNIKEETEGYKEKGIVPTIGIVRVGARADDIAYEKSVLKNCQEVGIAAEVFELDSNISMSDFSKEFSLINDRQDIHGILLFRPLPEQLDINKIQLMISPEKDIDCMHPDNLRKVFEGDEKAHYPCTPEAVVEILKYYDIPLRGSNIAVVNRSMVLGKPLSMMLIKEDATVTICHSKSVDIPQITRNADIVVTGVGKPNFFTENYFSNKNVVIDVGINYVENKMCGDVAFDEAEEVVKAITPVPGGVGTVTSTILLMHVIKAVNLLGDK